MPLIIPNNLPAADALKKENIFTMENARAARQDIRPLEILIVNLMPTKIATEIQLARVLANTPLQVELTLLCMDTHESQNTTREHLNAFYKTLPEIKNKRFDGMILTGAPVETIPFEEVDYWDELCDMLEYAKKNVYSSMHICWGAQAGLYYHYGIDKHPMERKLSGVFEHTVVRPQTPLLRGFDETFYAPHSRHTYVRKEDIEKHPEIRILVESEEAGPHILATDNGRQIFIFGHQEYDKETLDLEYKRDVQKGVSIGVPENYYKDDDPGRGILFRWRGHGSLLFSNWLNYYVYQETPYDLSTL
jgi:homoserine O-succinyltransferase